MHTIRQTSWFSSFLKRDESIFDAFGIGYSSTCISAGLGMVVARDLLGKKNHVISVIGDGAMTASQAYEAMNNAGNLDCIILAGTINVEDLVTIFRKVKVVAKFDPSTGKQSKSKSLTLPYTRCFVESLIKETEADSKIVAIHAAMGGGKGPNYFQKKFPERCFDVGIAEQHAVTFAADWKGKDSDGRQQSGHPWLWFRRALRPHADSLRDHGIYVTVADARFCKPLDVELVKRLAHELVVAKFDPSTGKQSKSKSLTLPYTRCFVESLIKETEADSKIVAIHAAMGGGKGPNYFQKKFPERCFDVGIAEQHAVTFAAGLATEGLKPFCTIYSSFLQRGYDQAKDKMKKH
ncbi:putative 1-deoxy-D-xylulose-5-phosphate synthase, chloroplastic [Cocos nucifera]|uniref:1-deoxy-D-xylulose-5-phosphate synthase n=1 Tax=Cocos nucifera TaxID=13894 RepID=A0A8K0IWB3_COCNU|nr:putative 1-deoxy-D-xylulose-5-phosphate synthase, chloroplastic [Cocos nucifera]